MDETDTITVVFAERRERSICILDGDDREIFLPVSLTQVSGPEVPGALVRVEAPIWLLTREGLL